MAFRGNGNLSEEQAEIRQLNEENKQLKMKTEILKKEESSLLRKRSKILVYCSTQEDLAVPTNGRKSTIIAIKNGRTINLKISYILN
ncbi:hypothetical protein [Legionella sainthelensi]|uniref:hypothetical protein n=1 Tax=Legionella sainthelensi TaxID=28087 RepID=UPI000E2015EF|nr:hypothetical protein [Legionella sainthelensi]